MRKYDDNDIQELKDIVRMGIVSSINAETMTARVNIPEQNIVTGDLKILQNVPSMQMNDNLMTDSEYKIRPWLPQIGQWVLCLFKPDGGGDGFILGGI